ncbi:MAG: hypothetical protein ACRD9R_09880 [Pyrinomonadaceae bacterium]
MIIAFITGAGLLLWLALVMDDMRRETKALRQELILLREGAARQHEELIAVARGEELPAVAANELSGI